MTTAIDRALEPHVHSGALRGYVYRVRAKGALHVGAAEMAPDALFRIASMTKPITAVVTHLLAREGVLSMGTPITEWLPELADPKVLRAPDAELDDVVPAEGVATVEDLLTMRFGLGAIMAPGPHPIGEAMRARDLGPHWRPPPHASTGEWVRQLAELPLLDQPGTTFRYDTSMTVLGALLERASGRSLAELYAERVFAPLGMRDTGFTAVDLDRLGPAYSGPKVVDPAGAESHWARTPGFASASGGLVSTAEDYGRFTRAMREGTLLEPDEYAAMTADRVPASAQTFFGPDFWEDFGWGHGLAVVRREKPDGPRGVGWTGGVGTTCFWDADGEAMLLTQELMGSPDGAPYFDDFFRAVQTL